MSQETRNSLLTTTLIPALLLVGCARIDPHPDYQRVSKDVERATGYAQVYEPGDEERVATQLAELLEDGITADKAARIALLHNPTLQSAFFDIGIARADVVQSGLFSNPSLGLALRLPAAGGLAAVEADLAQNIADLWQIPVRKRAAERALDRTILDVAAEAAETVAQAKSRYYAAVGADRRLAIAKKNLELTRKVLELSEFRRGSGAASELDVNLARGVVLEAQLTVQETRLAAADARRGLAETLGLQAKATTLVLCDDLPDSSRYELDVDALVGIALESRLDVRAARHAAGCAEERLVLEYRKVFPAVEVGVALERGGRERAEGRDLLADTARSSIAAGRLTAPDIEPRSARRVNTDFSIGPSLSLELPIFDQNQAQIARARFELEQVRRALAALETSVCQDVHSAADRAQTAWQVARFYRDEVLPQAQQNLDLSRESYKAGKSSILSVLDAERTYLSAGDRYAEALQAAATALPQLEHSVGLPIDRLLSLAGDDAISEGAPNHVEQPVETSPASDGDGTDSDDEAQG